MNSSGIKRGLAASAVAALAVAGIPALATSASAATGESATIAFVGPTRNAGDVGGLVVLKTKNITLAEAEDGLTLIAPNLTTTNPDTPSQNVDIVAGSIALAADGATNPFGGADGFDEISFRVTATTPAAGDAVKYAAFFDDGEEDTNDNGAIDGAEDANTDGDLEYNGAVDADEARVQVETTTSGAVAQVDVTPSSQTAPLGQPSSPYTVKIMDAQGRATQLAGAEQLDVTQTGGNTTYGAPATGGVIDKGEIAAGQVDFTATPTTTPGLRTITVAASGGSASGSDTATLDGVPAADLAVADVDVVTGADSWSGFGDVDSDASADPDNPVAVRVDQGTIRIDIASDDPDNRNATVVLTVNGTGDVTFGGKQEITVSTRLNSNGEGSLTITPDAGSVQENDDFTVAGAGLGTLNFQFQRAKLSTVQAPANVYLSALKGSVDITVTAADQFGLPIAGADVDAQRTAGANVDATAQRKTVDASGHATFTFTDASAVVGQTSTVTFRGYDDRFDATPNAGVTDTATIKYTADGLGADYTLALDSVNTAGTTYTPANVSIIPLTDTVADFDNGAGDPTGDEITHLLIAGGETGAPVTVSVDGGALVLKGADNDLSDGKPSVEGVVGDTFSFIGTKSGVVTVTVASAGRTKTAQFTVEAQSDNDTARNVTLSGPAQSAAGSLATFNAVATDAFGNPVPGVPINLFNVQVSGPAALQDSGAVTDANGMIPLNVRLQDDALGTVTVTVTGIPNADNQFGARADEFEPGDGVGSAPGLSASSNTATATTTAVAPPVEDEPVNPKLNVTGKGGGKDRIKANAISAASGAKATLWVKGKKVKSGTLNSAGNITFKVKDKNGKKATRYVVKISGTTKTLGARDAVRVK